MAPNIDLVYSRPQCVMGKTTSNGVLYRDKQVPFANCSGLCQSLLICYTALWLPLHTVCHIMNMTEVKDKADSWLMFSFSCDVCASVVYSPVSGHIMIT